MWIGRHRAGAACSVASCSAGMNSWPLSLTSLGPVTTPDRSLSSGLHFAGLFLFSQAGVWGLVCVRGWEGLVEEKTFKSSLILGKSLPSLRVSFLICTPR